MRQPLKLRTSKIQVRVAGPHRWPISTALDGTAATAPWARSTSRCSSPDAKPVRKQTSIRTQDPSRDLGPPSLFRPRRVRHSPNGHTYTLASAPAPSLFPTLYVVTRSLNGRLCRASNRRRSWRAFDRHSHQSDTAYSDTLLTLVSDKPHEPSPSLTQEVGAWMRDTSHSQ